MKNTLVLFTILALGCMFTLSAHSRDMVKNRTSPPCDAAASINQGRTSAGVRNTEKNISNTGKNYTNPNTRPDYSGTSTSGNINDYRSGSSMRNNDINRSNTGKNYTDPNTRIDYSGTRGKSSRNDPVMKR